MATTVQVSYKGKWRSVPQNSYDAVMCNWHKGADIPTHSWFEIGGRYQQIYHWCKKTFDVHHFKVFEDSVWFIEEKDALLCQLRWT